MELGKYHANKIIENDPYTYCFLNIVKQASAGNLMPMDISKPPENVQRESFLPKALNTGMNVAFMSTMLPQSIKSKAVTALKAGFNTMKAMPKI